MNDHTDTDAFRIAWGQHCANRLALYPLSRLEGYTGPMPSPITEHEYNAFKAAYRAAQGVPA